MGEVRHTAGPWRLRTNRHTATNGESWGWVSENTDANISLPGLSRFEWQGDTGRANARLIAASPDGYEANRFALTALCAVRNAEGLHPNLVKDIDFAIDALRAAISKATGSDQ